MTIGIPILQIVQENENGLLSADPSWSRVLLGEVAQVLNGFAFPSKNFSRVKGKPLLRIRDILQDQTAVLYDGQYDTAYLVHPNDLVIGMDGDFNCALWKGPEALLNQRVCKVTSNELFYSSKFLKYALPGYLQAVNARTSSQTVKHLSSRTVADIPLPLPPLPEQQRIVAKIEELFTRLDAGVEELKKIKAQLKRYRQSVLKHGFEGKLTKEWRQAHQHELEPTPVLLKRIKQERHKTASGKHKELPRLDTSDLFELPEGWVWAGIGAIVESMQNGIYKQRHFYSNDGVACLRMYNIQDGKIVWKDIKRMNLTADELERYGLMHGDILVNRVNSRELVGKTAPIPSGLETCVYESKNIRIRLLDGVESKYIAFWFQIFAQGFFNRNAQQTVGMASINQEQIASMPIPFTVTVEQQQVVSEIERRFSVADQIEKTVDHSLKQAERLRQSILKRAFEGKLVPQDPNNEPAEKLLEHIKEERAKQQAAAKSAKSPKTKRSTKQMRLV